MQEIQQLIEKEEYKKAVQKLVIQIEQINKNTIGKENLNFYDIMEVYRLSDKARYNIMIDINYIYEQMTNKEIGAKDCAMILKQKCEELIRC